MSNRVAILGEGAWGIAVATLLAHNGYEVVLWCHESGVQAEIEATRYNSNYLPGIHLDQKIIPTTDLQVACAESVIFEAIPVKFLRSVLDRARDYYMSQQTWVILSKGIEQETMFLPSQMLDDVFQSDVAKAVMFGPSFAQDLAARSVTAVTLAAHDQHRAREIAQMLANNYFKPYLSDDVIGVQVGGALKNVMSIVLGMSEGAGASENSRAFLFTRGLAEMAQVARALGGKSDTVYGLSGVGDLFLSSSGTLGRNNQVGKRLGRGESLDSILEHTGYIPEGINTVRSLYQLSKKYQLDLPVFCGTYEIVYGTQTVRDLLKRLVDQSLDSE